MKNFYSLFKKDCQMMIAGKFIFVAFGSLLIYTLFINFGYINFMMLGSKELIKNSITFHIVP